MPRGGIRPNTGGKRPNAGRKKTENPKKELIAVRLTAEEKAAIRHNAAEAKKSISEFVVERCAQNGMSSSGDDSIP